MTAVAAGFTAGLGQALANTADQKIVAVQVLLVVVPVHSSGFMRPSDVARVGRDA